MRSLYSVFNIFAMLILMFAYASIYKTILEDEKQLEQMKLNKVINYASNNAFNSVITEGSIDVDKYKMNSITVNPTTILDTYKSIILKSYDIGINQSSLDMMDNYISSAVIALDNGYYIATAKDKNDSKLTWGLKKPYIQSYPNDSYVSYNMLNERWSGYKEVGVNDFILERGQSFKKREGEPVDIRFYTGEVYPPDRDDVTTLINEMIEKDINFNLKERNRIYEDNEGVTDYYLGGQKDFIKLPNIQTTSGVNPFVRPIFFTTLSNVDFASTKFKLEARTVGGSDVTIRPKVVAFTENGKKYYCYDGQLPSNIKAEYVFPDVDSASKKGYYPNMKYLVKEMTKELKY